jgi:eukaryotic-like serine/threonine-protein kinase
VSSSASSIRVVPAAAGAAVPGVGKYRYIAALAEGGMADVYLAVTRDAAKFEKLFVIKELRNSLAQDPTFVAMFMDEARLAARLNHPNVVQTYEVGTSGDRHFLAMEFLEGVSYAKLAGLRERLPPPLAFHLRILVDVLHGLHYAHDLRDFGGTPLHVVHRDVSPQNVMLTFTGQVKVLDFGIAKAALAVEKRPRDFKGKLEYMAPEQALVQDVDRRADLFAVGVMLWEAVARRRLYERGEDKYERLVSGQLPDILSVRPDTPRRLALICQRALARRPEDRYATALEMADDLEAWLQETTQLVGSRDLGSYLEEKFARTRAKLAEVVDGQLKLFRALPESPSEGFAISRIPVTEPPSPDFAERPPPSFVPPGSEHPTGSSAPRAWTGPPSSGRGMPPAPARPSRGSRVALAIAGLVGLSAVASVAVLVSQRRPPAAEAEATARDEARLAEALPGEASRGSGVPDEAERVPANDETSDQAALPAEIEYTISASPKGATIFVDGHREASNPAKGTRLRDGEVHVVRVEAEGHEPKEQELAFDRSFYLTLELRRVEASSAPETAPARAVRSRRPVRPRSPPSPPPRGGGGLDLENPYE